MRHYNVNRVSHTVYDEAEELPNDITPVTDWKNAAEGDWVLADDGCYIQILKRGSMSRRKGKIRKVSYFRTCTGTYVSSSFTITEYAQSAYTGSGQLNV